MKYFLVASFASLAVMMPDTGRTEEFAEIEPTPWYENEELVEYTDNTGALGVGGDTAADIVNEANNGLAGALKGEITLRTRDDIVEVYSNGNLVENIVKGIGGTGLIKEKTSSRIIFEPAGRPALHCPVQNLSDWFGPCKVVEGEAV